MSRSNEFLNINSNSNRSHEKLNSRTFKSIELAQSFDNTEEEPKNALEDISIDKEKVEDIDCAPKEIPINRHYWYRGELMQLVPDALTELENNNEVVVEQKIELLEILTGCETANRYNVYLIDKNNNKKFLMKCKESSSWFCRNCVPSNDRSFDLEVIHIKNSDKTTNYKETIGFFKRPYQFTCCCLCRPVMFGTYGAKQKKEKTDNNIVENEPMGEIIENCACGSNISVKGEDGTIKYKVIGDYSQCGYFCRFLSIGKCYEVDFWIYENDADPNKDKPVGNIHKVFKGLSELITDSDAFILTFPKNATAIERVLLIAAVIMIDYRYYETVALFDCGNLI